MRGSVLYILLLILKVPSHFFPKAIYKNLEISQVLLVERFEFVPDNESQTFGI